MRIVFMNGGLGNQLFQYIFLRWLELNTGEGCIIDDSPFFGENVPHNGYELERIFGIRKKRLSEHFDADVWAYLVKQRQGVDGIEQALRDAGMEFQFIYDTRNFHYDGPAVDVRDIGPGSILKGDTYYHGYWLGELYFNAIADRIRQELAFPPLAAPRNRDLQAMIRQSNAVCVHIRRGDMAKLGWSSGPEHFAQAIAKMETLTQHAKYFLFSDDLGWCREHWQDLGLEPLGSRVIVVDGNRGDEAYIDLQLMALCRHFISDRSSFSLLASLLSLNKNKICLSHWA